MKSLLTTLLLTVVCGPHNCPPASSRTILTPARLSTTQLTKTEPGQETSITEANWQQHPKIISICKIVNSVDAGVRRGIFKTSQKRFEDCEGGYETYRRMAVDRKGVVRRYEMQGGTEDHLLTYRHYYDEAGRIRFVYIIGGAANGTRIQHRIYFDENGHRIWEAHKNVEGQGYPGFSNFPDDELSISKPTEDFAAASQCKEIKPKPKRRVRRT